MTWTTLGEKLDAKAFRSAIKTHLSGQRRTICIGRSRNSSGFSNSTRIEMIDGDSAPELLGHPYLSTTFRRGSFSKTLYTPSTLRVVVGRGWKPSR